MDEAMFHWWCPFFSAMCLSFGELWWLAGRGSSSLLICTRLTESLQTESNCQKVHQFLVSDVFYLQQTWRQLLRDAMSTQKRGGPLGDWPPKLGFDFRDWPFHCSRTEREPPCVSSPSAEPWAEPWRCWTCWTRVPTLRAGLIGVHHLIHTYHLSHTYH